MSNASSGGHGRPPHRPPPLHSPPPARGPSLEGVRPSEQRTTPPAQQQRPGHPPPQRAPGAGPYRQAHAGGPAPRYATPRHGAPHPRGRGGPGVLGILMFGLVGIAVLAGVGVAFLALSPPTDLIRREAIAAVKRQTGRDLVISGPAKLSFYPTLGISLADVTLSAPPGMKAPPTVKMQSLEVALEPMALLSRRVEVNRLVLTRPAFDLRVDRAGRASWDVAAAADAAPVRVAEARAAGTLADSGGAADQIVVAQATGKTAAGERPPAVAALGAIRLDDVRVVDGTVSYTDERSGAAHRVTSLDAQFSAPAATGPLAAKGDLDWQGEAIAFDANLSTLQSLLNDKRAKVVLDLQARPVAAKYSGALDVSAGAALDGTLGVKSPSLRALAAWLDRPLPQSEGFGPLSIDGRLKTSPGLVTLDSAELSLDALKARGNIAAATTGARPHVKADLKISELDLNAYIGAAGATRPAPAAAPAATAPAAPPRAAPPAPAAPAARQPTSIEDLLQQPAGPRVKGYTARAGWSDEPFDVSLLDLVDADAKLSVGRLLVRDLRIGQSDVVLALRNRVAKVTLERVQLYEGTGRGIVTLDAAGAAPQLGANLVVDGVAAAGLLKDAAAIDWLSGSGRLTAALTGTGTTQLQLVRSLNGRLEARFADGAITGFNVAKVIRGLGQGRLAGLSATPTEKTDFSELSASFDVADGVASNQDLKLMSPLLRVGGSGQIDLPGRQLDYVVRPKLVSDLAGQGGAAELGGLEIPVKITGAWDKPKFAPDLSKIDVGQAAKAVEQIGKNLKGKDADEIVDSLLGKGSKEGEQAKKLLDKWLR